MKTRTYDGDGRLLSEEDTVESPQTQEQRNADTLRQQIDAALEANRSYLAAPAPTSAQTAIQVKLLTRETTAIIRLLLLRLDGTD